MYGQWVLAAAVFVHFVATMYARNGDPVWTWVDSDLFKNAILSGLSKVLLKKIATMYGQWFLAAAVLSLFVATMYACRGDPLWTWDDSDLFKNAILSGLSEFSLKKIA